MRIKNLIISVAFGKHVVDVSTLYALKKHLWVYFFNFKASIIVQLFFNRGVSILM